MGDLGIRHLGVTSGGEIVGVVSVRDLLIHYKRYAQSKITPGNVSGTEDRPGLTAVENGLRRRSRIIRTLDIPNRVCLVPSFAAALLGERRVPGAPGWAGEECGRFEQPRLPAEN